MENNEKTKKGKVLVVLVCLLSLGVVLLGGYSLYDKFYLDKNNSILLEEAKNEIKNKEKELSEVSTKLKECEDKANTVENNEKGTYSNFLKELKNNRFASKEVAYMSYTSYDANGNGNDIKDFLVFNLSKDGKLSYSFFKNGTPVNVDIASNVLMYEVRNANAGYYFVYYLTEDGTVYQVGNSNGSDSWKNKAFKITKMKYKDIVNIVATNSQSEGDMVFFIDINGNVEEFYK